MDFHRMKGEVVQGLGSQQDREEKSRGAGYAVGLSRSNLLTEFQAPKIPGVNRNE